MTQRRGLFGRFLPQGSLQPPRSFSSGASAWRDPVLFANDLQLAYKALPYNQYIQDFISSSGGDLTSPVYSDYQREGAYRTSVYLFACLRRGANLMSEMRIVAEGKRDGKWERLPETHDLNRIFADAGAKFLFQTYAFFAMYGSALIYKRKTRRAVYAMHRGTPITTYPEGAIAGIHVIPNAHWTPDPDPYGAEVRGFHFNTPDEHVGERRYVTRSEVVYLQDFDPRLSASPSTSMVDLAINNAVTNAAIARWAANYFMSGALPLLLLSLDSTDPSAMTQSDAERYKNFIERAWRGVFGRFSMRAVFTERKLHVQQAGIEADKVQAPELDRAALNAIASVFQIAPDLIVPPEGGSDNARHKFLVMQAYNDGIIPLAKQWVAQINDDFGLDGTSYRLVLDESNIRALEADRGDIAQTELNIFTSGVQRFGDVQNRLRVQPIPELKDFINVNGRFQSVERVLRDDRLPSADIMQYIHPAWTDGVITRNEYRRLLGFSPADHDGYKYQVVPEPGAVGFGAPPDEPPPSPSAPDELPPEPPLDPSVDGGHSLVPSSDDGDDGDKTIEIRQSDENRPSALEVVRLDTGIVVAQSESPTADGDGERQTSDPDVCVMLMCAGDSFIHTARNGVIRALGDDAARVTWTAPEAWYCALIYAPSAEADALMRARLFMPSHMPALTLRLNGLMTFGTSDGTCLALRVDPSDALRQLQAAMVQALAAQGVALSPDSAPADDQPHIALGYAPREMAVPNVRLRGAVEPSHIAVTHGGQDLFIIPSIRALTLADSDLEPMGADEHEARGLGYIEDRLLETYRRRAVLEALFRRWLNTGQRPDGVPASIVTWIDDLKDVAGEAAAVQGALTALAAGALDEQAAHGDRNPLIRYVNTGRSIQMTAEDELRAWERAALRHRTKALMRFEVRLIPTQIERAVRDALRTAADQNAVKAVFAQAREQLAAFNAPPAQLDVDLFAQWAERIREYPALRDLVEGDEGDVDDDSA